MRRSIFLCLSASFLGFAVSEEEAQGASLRVGATEVSATSGSAAVAGQRYRAGSSESLEVILPDGTSVTIGAGGSTVVDRFDWTSGGSGRAILRLGAGTYRISGGALGRAGQLFAFAGGTQISVGNATAVVTVGRDGAVRVYMTVGSRVVVTSGGRSERITRAGYATVVPAGGSPARATRVSSAHLLADRSALRPTRSVAAWQPARASTRSEPRGEISGTDQDIAFIDDSEVLDRYLVAEAILGFQSVETDTENDGSNKRDEKRVVIPPREEQLDRSITLASALAPGIGVTSPSQPNLSGNNGSSANGAFFDSIFDDEDVLEQLASEEANGLLTLERILEIAEIDIDTLTDLVIEAVGPDFFPVMEGSTNALIGTSASGTLSFPRSIVQQQLSGSPGDLDYFWVSDTSGSNDLSTQYVIDDGHLDLSAGGDQLFTSLSFLDTADPEGIGGLQSATQNAPFSGGLGGSGTQALSFHAGFPTAEDHSFGALIEGDAFVMHHFLERQDGALNEAGTSFVFAGGSLGSFDALGAVQVVRLQATFGLLGFEDEGEVFPDFQYRRAFLPAESAFAGENRAPIDIHSNDIMLAFRPETGEVDAQLLHGDAGFEGSRSAQKSTLSISVGDVRQISFMTRLAGHTFGSSRDSAKGIGSTFFSSPLVSTSVGGGNPQIPTTGMPGYLVVENSDMSGIDGGHISPMRQADDTPDADFLMLRLLSATGSASEDSTSGAEPPEPDFASRASRALSGYAAGLAEAQVGDGSQIASGFADAFSEAYRPNLSISTDAGANRLSALISLSGAVGGTNTFSLGGLDSATHALSAYVDDFTFGARTAAGTFGAGYALASSAVVTRPSADATAEIVGLGTVRRYQHMRWGMFLGDRIWDEEKGLREHVHLGTWVAGDPVDRSEYDSFTGEATYTGHAIGNAFDGTSLYTALGSYENTWNFGSSGDPAKMTGNVVINFDGREYKGDTRIKPADQRGFSGNLDTADRIGEVHGDFFGGVSEDAKGNSPNAVGGQFAISNKRDAGTYRASGTFAGEK